MKILRARKPRRATAGVSIVAGNLSCFCALGGGDSAIVVRNSDTPGARQPVSPVIGSLVAFLTKGPEHVPPSL